jgi:predicted Fe-Mo cluster-binding NifX family protein
MHPRLHRLTLVTATMLLSLASSLQLAGTNLGIKAALAQETKVSQCGQVIAIANEAVSNAKTITNNGNSSALEGMLRAAKFMDDSAEKMENVSLSDPMLQRFQARFILMYRQTSEASRDFVKAYQAQNRPEAELAYQALQIATSREKQLVEEINNYCGSESATDASALAQT